MILSEILKKELKKKMNDLNIHFEFYHSNFTQSNWNWTSLMEPEKKNTTIFSCK